MGAYAVTKNVVTQSYKVDATVTPVAGADDIARYRIVKLLSTGDHTIIYATDATDIYAGVTVCGGNVGDILDVQQGGLAIVEAGGAIAVNDPIIAGTAGVATTGAGIRLGQAVTSATNAGDLIVVQIDQG
jgi:hypothetical protein